MINPFEHMTSPNHYLYLDKELWKQIINVHEKLRLSFIDENGNYNVKITVHAVSYLLQNLLYLWRIQKINEATEETLQNQEFHPLTEPEKEAMSNEVCYTQYAQVLTHMLWQLPVDISRAILETCLLAQEKRNNFYFGDQENEENKDLS